MQSTVKSLLHLIAALQHNKNDVMCTAFCSGVRSGILTFCSRIRMGCVCTFAILRMCHVERWKNSYAHKHVNSIHPSSCINHAIASDRMSQLRLHCTVCHNSIEWLNRSILSLIEFVEFENVSMWAMDKRIQINYTQAHRAIDVCSRFSASIFFEFLRNSCIRMCWSEE